MYAKALIKGLTRFIAEVEKLPDNTSFVMTSYYSCVIGKTLGWPGFYMPEREREALKVYFDIRRQHADKYFAKHKAADFKPEHWEVIRLFTSDIGEKITKHQWLELAKTQLAKMMESK